MTSAEAVEPPVARVPELRQAYDDHVRGYDELHPHVFFGDVSRRLPPLFAEELRCRRGRRPG